MLHLNRNTNNPYLLLVENLVQLSNHKLYKILNLLYPYLLPSDLITLSTLNSTFNTAVDNFLWESPPFEQLGYIHDSLYIFNRFLQHISTIETKKKLFVRKIDISFIEENLYDRVNPHFFRILNKLSNLTHLDLSKSDFLTTKCLPAKVWSLPHLTYLNLSYCAQVNDSMLVQISRGCRQLIEVRLDGLSKHKGQGLACFASECDRLESVSVRYNTNMTDEGIVALAKFRHIKLLKLDITGCMKISSSAFETLARYAAHLNELSLAGTSCQIQELSKFTCTNLNTKILDISNLKLCSGDLLCDWLWRTNFRALKHLTIGMKTMIELVKRYQDSNQLYAAISNFNNVENLLLTGLEEYTPITYLKKILILFPNLNTLVFRRDYFESDFVLGTYSKASKVSEEYITDSNLQQFNLSQSKVSVSIIHDREADTDTKLENW